MTGGKKWYHKVYSFEISSSGNNCLRKAFWAVYQFIMCVHLTWLIYVESRPLPYWKLHDYSLGTVKYLVDLAVDFSENNWSEEDHHVVSVFHFFYFYKIWIFVDHFIIPHSKFPSNHMYSWWSLIITRHQYIHQDLSWFLIEIPFLSYHLVWSNKRYGWGNFSSSLLTQWSSHLGYFIT
jgi:hypothetical protein